VIFLNKIKELRKKFNETQTDLGKIIGTDKSTISKYENETYIIPPEVLIKIANHYDVTVDYILGRDDELLKVEKRLKDNNIKAYTFSDIDLKKYSELDEEKRKLIAKQMNAMIDIFLEEKDKE